MGFFSRVFRELQHHSDNSTPIEINPATGLPMINGTGGIDIEGNAYGQSDHDLNSPNAITDPLSDYSSTDVHCATDCSTPFDSFSFDDSSINHSFSDWDL